MQVLESYSKIKMTYNTDLVNNILTRGIESKTMQIIKKGKPKND